MTNYSAARKGMVENQIETSSVTDQRLLSVLRAIPRERFLPAPRREFAYSDAHHPLGKGRFLAAPAVFARLVQLADVGPEDRVLDYGAGTGYSTAVLAGLARQVVGLETEADLVATAQSTLADLDISNARFVADQAGLAELGMFDAIVVEGALETTPSALLDMLAPGGRLVFLLRQGPIGVATLCKRTDRGIVAHPSFNATLPALDRTAVPEAFVF